MPKNQQSWNSLMKDPDFHNKYDLNTNPLSGRTYIPKSESTSENINESSGNTDNSMSMDEYREYLEIDDDY